MFNAAADPPARGARGYPVRAALRAATAPAHERLHRNGFFAPLLDGRADRAAYRTLLERLLGIHAPLEEMLAGEAGVLTRLAVPVRLRRRVPLLLEDLAALGADDAMVAALPRCMDMPRPASAAGMLGCLYVREGATLGGAVLAARVAHLAAGDAGRRFFLGEGSRHRGWRACCAAIEREGARPCALDEMIDAACAVFAAFERWLEPTPHG